MVNEMNNSSKIDLVNLPEESKPIWTNIERVKKPLHGEGKTQVEKYNLHTSEKYFYDQKKQQHNWLKLLSRVKL